MRPSATRPTSFWRGESGPFVGLSDAPMCTAISAQGFLTRSRMRLLAAFLQCSLEICLCEQAFALLFEI